MVGAGCLAPGGRWTGWMPDGVGPIRVRAGCGWATKVVMGSPGGVGSGFLWLCSVICCGGKTLCWWLRSPATVRLSLATGAEFHLRVGCRGGHRAWIWGQCCSRGWLF